MGVKHGLLGETYAEGVWEFGAEENIWTLEGRGDRGWRKLHNEEINDLYSSPNIVRMIKSRRIMAKHLACTGERCVQGFGGETWGKETKTKA